MAAGGIADMLPADWQSNPQFLGIAGAVAGVTLLLGYFMVGGNKGASKKTQQKKAKKADKAKEPAKAIDGKKGPTSAQSTSENGEEPVALKKQKKAAASEEEKQAKKAEADRRKQQSLATHKKNQETEEKAAKNGGGKQAKAQAAAALKAVQEDSLSKLEKQKAAFARGQERVKKDALPSVTTSRGGFAALGGDDSD